MEDIVKEKKKINIRDFLVYSGYKDDEQLVRITKFAQEGQKLKVEVSVEYPALAPTEITEIRLGDQKFSLQPRSVLIRLRTKTGTFLRVYLEDKFLDNFEVTVRS